MLETNARSSLLAHIQNPLIAHDEGVLMSLFLDGGEFDVFHVAEALLARANEGDVVATHASHFCDFDFCDRRKAEGEDTLNPDTSGNLADRHRLTARNTTHFQYNPFVHLYALFFLTVRSCFFDLLVDADRHPRADLRRLNDGWKGDLVGHRWGQE